MSNKPTTPTTPAEPSLAEPSFMDKMKAGFEARKDAYSKGGISMFNILKKSSDIMTDQQADIDNSKKAIIEIAGMINAADSAEKKEIDAIFTDINPANYLKKAKVKATDKDGKEIEVEEYVLVTLLKKAKTKMIEVDEKGADGKPTGKKIQAQAYAVDAAVADKAINDLNTCLTTLDAELKNASSKKYKTEEAGIGLKVAFGGAIVGIFASLAILAAVGLLDAKKIASALHTVGSKLSSTMFSMENVKSFAAGVSNNKTAIIAAGAGLLTVSAGGVLESAYRINKAGKAGVSEKVNLLKDVGAGFMQFQAKAAGK